MDETSKRPLKILTLDGGGLQALATLSALNAVCRAVAAQNGAQRPPAPHELFDIIAGVGSGGWIALLLGRYRLDLATCTAVYMELATKVDVETCNPGATRRNRPFKLDQARLLRVVEEVLQRYGLDPALLRGERTKEESHKPSRCKYSFAAGVISGVDRQPAKYELFRSYHISKKATRPPHAGPLPDECRMPEVFAATGAARFFLKPYTIGDSTFNDDTFPQSHPISAIALDEAICLYGPNVEISVLLNIGPGIPPDKDCQELDWLSLGPMGRLVRRFSWPSSKRLSLKQILSFTDVIQSELVEKESRSNSPSTVALKLEGEREKNIRARLDSMYGPSGVERYHHLGPEYSVESASLNDVHALRLPRSESGHSKRQTKIEAEGMVKRAWVEAAA